MEEILKLREQFKSVQLQDSVHRLSERNCVEIIRKLLQQQKVQLIFTVDGKEYLTPQQLELEIKDEILSHGGRINVLDLQALLNVGLEHVEAKVAELVKKDKKLQMLHGDLITKNYLDGVAEELNEVIQEAGQLTLSDASKRFGLTSEFLHEALRERMGKIIHGSLENGMIYTAAFVQRYKAKMRGIFSAITKPTALTQLINDYNLQEKLFFGVLGELEKEGRLAGTIERGVYVPQIFAHARQKWISAFFEQNKYIEYQTLSKSSISDPRKYLQNLYPDGIALANCYVSSSLVKQIDASLEGYLLSGEDDLHKTFYVDVATLVEIPLTEEDMTKLLQACPLVQEGKAKVLGGHYCVASNFMEQCLAALSERVKSVVPGRLTTALLQNISGEGSKEEPEEEEEDAQSRSSSRRSKGGRNAEKDKKGKGKSKGGNKRGGNRKQEENAPARGGKGQQPTARSRAAIAVELFTPKEALQYLKHWYKGADEQFLVKVLEEVQGPLREMCKQAAEMSSNDAAPGKKKHLKLLDQQLGVVYQNIQFFKQSADQISEAYVRDVLRRHLLATLCNDLVSLLIQMQALYNIPELPVEDAEKSAASPTERAQLLSQLPPNISIPIKALLETLKDTSVDPFMEALESAAEACEVSFKPLDKKKQRLLTHTHKLDFMQQLEEAKDRATVFHLAVVLLYAQAHNIVLHAPTRVLPSLLPHLSSLFGPEGEEEAQRQMACLKAIAPTTDEGQEESPSAADVEEKLAAVKQLVNHYCGKKK